MNFIRPDMSTRKKPQTVVVVDNLRTQLAELLDSLDSLYRKLDTELDKLSSEFDHVNTVLIDGFRSVIEKRAPVDLVSDAASDDEEETEEAESSEEMDSSKKESVDEIVRMIQSWSNRS